MVAHCRVRHGAALAAAQLRFGHDLLLLEPGLPVGADEEEQEEPIGNFTIAIEAIMEATHVGDIILAVFFEP
jgi:hypothetical protein